METYLFQCHISLEYVILLFLQEGVLTQSIFELKETCCWSVFNDYGLMTNTLVLPHLRVIGTHCYLVRVDVVASGAVSIAAEAGPIFPGARQIVVDVVEGPL